MGKKVEPMDSASKFSRLCQVRATPIGCCTESGATIIPGSRAFRTVNAVYPTSTSSFPMEAVKSRMNLAKQASLFLPLTMPMAAGRCSVDFVSLETYGV
jgi:hypothetical protein